MSSKKFLIGGLVGGVVFFLLGWLLYGMLLMDFMMQHSNNSSGVFRAEAEMIWWAMIVGNLALGFLLSYVLNKANVAGAMAGATTGAIVMLLMSIGIDCVMYAQLNLWDTTAMIVDILVSTVIGAIVGAVIGWLNGRKS